MLSELRNEHNEVKRNFDIEITRLEETNNHLNTQQQQVDNFEENKNQRISRIQNQINSKNIDLENYKNEKSNVESLDEKPYIERLNELQEKITISPLSFFRLFKLYMLPFTDFISICCIGALSLTRNCANPCHINRKKTALKSNFITLLIYCKIS